MHHRFGYTFIFFSTVCTQTDRTKRGPTSGQTRDVATYGRMKAVGKTKETPNSGLKGTSTTLEENLSTRRVPELSV